MHIFYSGIGGAGIGPLAQIARDLKYDVTGSNDIENANTKALSQESGITVYTGQSAEAITKIHKKKPIDWYVYTAGLPADHPELAFVRMNAIRHSKRDAFINEIVNQSDLKLIAVSGTHGKTGTTGLLIWLFMQLNIPISYAIGTTLSFGPGGQHHADAEYFIYEADEFDKNMLRFRPYASLITSLDYDHPDTYPSVDDYKESFRVFISQSHCAFLWDATQEYLQPLAKDHLHSYALASDLVTEIQLPGKFIRQNASLALHLMAELFPQTPLEKLTEAINKFPGTARRFERLRENVYTDYAHHPKEIEATIQLATELGKPVVAVYQPHQNSRQHQLQLQYTESFCNTEKIYWLPTYQSRDYDSDLPILSPQELITNLAHPEKVTIADMNNQLAKNILAHAAQDRTVVLMSAGNLDEWARNNLLQNT